MKFCPKCGAVLIQKRTRWSCSNPNCSYSTDEKIKLMSSEIKEKREKIDILKEKDTNVLPLVSATCPKCGHRKVYYWSSQMRSGDEAETRFFRCEKCNETWREYS